jgi:hypothetical protein
MRSTLLSRHWCSLESCLNKFDASINPGFLHIVQMRRKASPGAITSAITFGAIFQKSVIQLRRKLANASSANQHGITIKDDCEDLRDKGFGHLCTSSMNDRGPQRVSNKRKLLIWTFCGLFGKAINHIHATCCRVCDGIGRCRVLLNLNTWLYTFRMGENNTCTG